METNSGIGTNVLFEDQGSKGVFTWNDGNTTHRLAVKTDVVTNPNAQIDDHPSTATGSAVVGTLVGGLIGSDPGYVESRLAATGYTYIRSAPRENGMDSF